MLATLSIAFTGQAESSDVLPPEDQQRVAQVLEDDAGVMSNTQLLAGLLGLVNSFRMVRLPDPSRPVQAKRWP